GFFSGGVVMAEAPGFALISEAQHMALEESLPAQHTRTSLLGEPSDFSLVLGGPLYQLLRKAHFEGDHFGLLYRRILFFTGIAWLPLFLLASVGPFAGSAGRFAFLHDVEVHVRFLAALPVLLAAELIVHLRLSPIVRRFVERDIVLPEDL